MLPAAELRGIICKFQVCHPGRMHLPFDFAQGTRSIAERVRAGIQNPVLTGSRIFFTALPPQLKASADVPEKFRDDTIANPGAELRGIMLIKQKERSLNG